MIGEPATRHVLHRPAPPPAPRPAVAVALVATRMLVGRDAVRDKMHRLATRRDAMVELAEDLQHGFVALTDRFGHIPNGRADVVARAAADLPPADLDLLIDGGLLPAGLIRPGLRLVGAHDGGPGITDGESVAVRELLAIVELLAALLHQVAASAGTAKAWADLRRWRSCDTPVDERQVVAAPESRPLSRGSAILLEMGMGPCSRLVDLSDPPPGGERQAGGTESPGGPRGLNSGTDLAV
jgi:hypothetical protein